MMAYLLVHMDYANFEDRVGIVTRLYGVYVTFDYAVMSFEARGFKAPFGWIETHEMPDFPGVTRQWIAPGADETLSILEVEPSQ